MDRRTIACPAAVVAVLAASVTMFAGTTPPAAASTATAASVQLTVGSDGTPGFDGSDGAGLDSSPNNGIVRTFDAITFQLEWSAGAADGADVVLTQVLAPSMAFSEVPAACIAGVSPVSAISPDGRTLTCNLGERAGGSHGSIQSTASVGGVADGTVVTSHASITTSAGAQQSTPDVAVSASSAPQFNLRADVVPAALGTVTDPVRHDLGVVEVFGVGVEVGGSGKGTEAIASPFTFVADVSGISANARVVDFTLPQIDEIDRPINACGPADVIRHLPFGDGALVDLLGRRNSTVDSGTWSCSQPSDGAPISVSVTGADTATSLYATTDNDGGDLGVDHKILVAGQIAVFIPMADVVAILGAPTGTFPATFSVGGFDPFGVGGASNYGAGVEPGGDNSHTTNVNVYSGCCGDSLFHNRYSDNYGPTDGPHQRLHEFGGHAYFPGMLNEYGILPTQTDQDYSGDGVVTAGQPISIKLVSGLAVDAGAPESLVTCAKIDPAVLRVIDAPATFRYLYTQSPFAITAVPVPSVPGRVANVIGYHADTALVRDDANLTVVEGVDYVIEYGTGGFGSLAAEQNGTCDDADSTTGWYPSPTAVPGGYGAISKVRMRTLHDLAPGDSIDAYISVAAQPGTPGDWVWYNASFGRWAGHAWTGTADNWSHGNYDPTTHDTSGRGYGDRAALGDATLSIDQATVPQPFGPLTVRAGNMFDLVVTSSVDGPAGSNGHPVPNVTITETLADGIEFISATPAPTSVAAGGGGTTVLTWSFGTVNTGTRLPVISIAAAVRAGTAPADLPIDAVIDGTIYQQSIDSRTAQVGVHVPSGVAEADVVTAGFPPTVASGSDVAFTVTYRNNGSDVLGPVTLIDVLPSTADGRSPASRYHGSLVLAEVSGTHGETFEYTAVPPDSIAPDPADPSNQPGGSTVWCALGSFGTGGCPIDLADVTAVRVSSPVMSAGSARSLGVRMTVEANESGDTYTNRVGQRMVALALATVSNDAAVVVGGVSGPATLHGVVRVDANHRGGLDTSDPGIGGIGVRATWAGPDGRFGTADDGVLWATSRSDGSVEFAGVPSGRYRVEIEPSTVPPGSDVLIGSTEVLVAYASTTDLGVLGVTTTAAAPNPAPPALAFTGASDRRVLMWGAILLAVGVVAVAAGRPRRRVIRRVD